MRITVILLLAVAAEAGPWATSKAGLQKAQREERLIVYAASSDWM